MKAGDKVIGVIAVQSYIDDHLYSQEDLEILQTIASQAAIALENARLHQQTDKALAQKVKELMTLEEIDRQLALVALDLEKVLDLVLERAITATDATAGAVAILDEERKGLLLLSQKGYPEEISVYKEQPWPLDRGIVGKVARTGKACLCLDVSKDPDYVSVIPEVRCLLSVPVMREGRVIGVITLESTREDAFTEEDLRFIQHLADRAGIAFQNAMLYAAAREANEAKSRFISIVYHDLRNPMTAINGYAELLIRGREGPINEKQRRSLEKIRSLVRRMASLVSDLQDLSLLEAGKVRLVYQPVHIAEVVNEVVESLEGVIRDKKLQLYTQIPAPLPPVRGDRSRIFRILENLVANACYYTDEGSITISARAVGEMVQVSVSDTGRGIPEKEQPQIFQRFFRGEEAVKKKREGTGLGLYIAKTFVEMHGGRIWFESEEGKGTTFHFTLPIWNPRENAR